MALAKIGKKDDFPKDEAMVVEVNGRLFAVYNTQSGIFATDNTCPHEDGPLGEGMLSGCIITCPRHGWTFDIKTGQCQLFPHVKIETFKVVVDDAGDVFLELP